MHVRSTATAAAAAVLLAAVSLASPLRDGVVDGLQGDQQYGQLPFLAEQSVHQVAAQAVLNPSYAGLPSLESFQSLLEADDYRQLVAHVNSLPERRIIALSEDAKDRHIITEGQKALLTFHSIKFIDITESISLEDTPSTEVSLQTSHNDNKESNDAAFPKKWTYGREELHNTFYRHIDTSRMRTFLQAFSSFRTRYYRSSDGRQSQLFLLEKIQQLITTKKNKHLKMTVEEFPHPWGQNSLIVKLPANDTANAKGTIVVGAHQDSTNLLPFLSAP